MRTREHDSPRARLPIWRRLGWRLSASILLLTSLGILVSGLLQYRVQEQWVRQSLGSLLLNIARTGALLVDGDLHQKVVRQGRTDTPEYTEVWAQLRRARKLCLVVDALHANGWNLNALADKPAALESLALTRLSHPPHSEIRSPHGRP